MTTATVTAVRRLEPRDIGEASRIANLCIARGESTFGPGCLPVEELSAELFDAPAQYEAYVSETSTGALAGWAALLRHTHRDIYDTVAELAVFVDTEHRRAGIGRTLVQRVLDRATALHFRVLLLLLQPEPAHVVAWAFRLGFRRAGGLTGVLPVNGCWKDLLLFERSVQNGAERTAR
jgi:L-amino acid N-acyltransferase YncA